MFCDYCLYLALSLYARAYALSQVVGSSVIFKCDKGVIQQHVYIDASTSKAPREPDCTGKVKYVMPIKNGCNNYDWGSMYMAWEGFCEAPKDDGKGDGKGDGKDDGKGDGKGDKKCAAIADIVRFCCVHVQFAG